MNNPFENYSSSDLRPRSFKGRDVFNDVSEPSHSLPDVASAKSGKRGRGEFTLNDVPSFEIRRQNLKPDVRVVADRLHTRLLELYKKYGATNVKETYTIMLAGKNPKPEKDDLVEICELLDDLSYALEKNAFSPDMAKKEKLYESERSRLSAFFGRDIEVPPLPDWIRHGKIEEWERKRLELHYLPPFDMSKESPKGWIRPRLNHVDLKKLSPDAMALPGCWVICDGRPKPKYENSDTMYEDDEEFLSPVLEGLVKDGLVEKWGLNPKTRFFVSLHDLNKPEVMEALAKAYGLNPGEVAVQRMIEFNVLGNVYHPEWGEPPSESSEWFNENILGGEFNICGGNSRSGGLSSLSKVYPGDNIDGTAFRLVGYLK